MRIARAGTSAVDEVCTAVVRRTMVGMPWSEIISSPAAIDRARRGRRWVSGAKVSAVWRIHGNGGMSLVPDVHEIQVASNVGHRIPGDILQSCVWNTSTPIPSWAGLGMAWIHFKERKSTSIFHIETVEKMLSLIL